MSNPSTSFTSDGEGGRPALISKLIDLSDSLAGGNVAGENGYNKASGIPRLLGNFPNIRRKKKVSKAERDRLLQTFEDRSTSQQHHHANEVDLGFLERKRIVLKKKQELLNKTLLANKNKKQKDETTTPLVASSIARPKQELPQPQQKLPLQRETDSERTTVNQQTRLENNTTSNESHPSRLQSPKEHERPKTLVDHNFERTSVGGTLPNNETKTTINFNIYNAELDPFKETKGSNDGDRPRQNKTPSSPLEEDIHGGLFGKPKLHKSQSINMESADENDQDNNKEGRKPDGKSSFEKDAEQKSRNYVRSVLCCQTLFSIVIYVVLFVLIGVSLLFAFKNFHITNMFTHHPYHNRHDKNEHESQKKAQVSSHHNGTLKHSKNSTTLMLKKLSANNATSLYKNITTKLEKSRNGSINDNSFQEFFATLSNATIEKLKEQETKQTNKTSVSKAQNEKRQNIPRVPVIQVLKPATSSEPITSSHEIGTSKQPSLSNTPIPSPTTHSIITTPIYLSPQINATKLPTTTATTTMSTTTLNPFIEAAKSVLASLNISKQLQIQQQHQAGNEGFNAGSIDLGDSVTENKNPSPVVSIEQQSPTYSSSSPASSFQDGDSGRYQEQYYNQGSPRLDDQNMFMDQTLLPEHQWDFENENYNEKNQQERTIDLPDGRSSIQRQYGYSPQQQPDEKNVGGYRSDFTRPNEDRRADLTNFDPFKDPEEEGGDQQPTDSNGLKRRSDTRKTSEDDTDPVHTTPTTTTVTTTTTTTATTTTTVTPKPLQPRQPSTTTTVSPATTTAPFIQLSSSDSQRPLVIAENVEQYMSPRILSRDPLENTDRNVHSDSILTAQKQIDDDDGEDDENEEEAESQNRRFHLSHRHKEFFPTRHTRGNDFKEVENEEIKPFDKEMGSKEKNADDDDGDIDVGGNDPRPRHRHLIPVVHKDYNLGNDEDLKITVSKLKDSLADDLKDIKKKFSRLSQKKELDGVEKMIKILNHDSATDHSESDLTTKSFHELAKEEDDVLPSTKKNSEEQSPSDDMMSTIQQQKKLEETGNNMMSLMLNEEKKLQSKVTPDLMNEFVAFEKSKQSPPKSDDSADAKKRKTIPKKKVAKKQQTVSSKTKQVKTYKLKTCVQIKAFNPGVLAQIVKGPMRSDGKIRYDVRTCTRKKKKRHIKMTCEDITYRISTGKISVKPIGWENAKKVYAVFGCKGDADRGADSSMMLMNRDTDGSVDDSGASDMMMGGGSSSRNEGAQGDDGDSNDDSSGSGSDDDVDVSSSLL